MFVWQQQECIVAAATSPDDVLGHRSNSTSDYLSGSAVTDVSTDNYKLPSLVSPDYGKL